jgi:hypothetical protein
MAGPPLTVVLILIPTLLLLAIASLLVIGKVWSASTSSRELHRRRNESVEYIPLEALPRIEATLQSAAKGYTLSQWDIAQILREALLNKFSGNEPYPKSWICTQEGRKRLLQILGSNNKDLLSVLEPPEQVPRRRAPRFLRRLRISTEYLRKVERAVLLLEGQKGS